MPRLRWIALCFVVSGWLPPAQANAQAQGVAAITAPLEGATVSGLTPILGTAADPRFQRYELAFGYDPNPTNTWFSIGEPSTSQIVNDVLGSWDTTGLADGAYVLRLRVYWSEQDFLEAFVRRVQVQNATPTPTRAPAVTDTPSPPSIGVAATPTGAAGTQPVIALPPTITPRPTPGSAGVIGGGGGPTLSARLSARMIAAAFLDGVRLTIIIFAFLGVYAGLRALLRSRWRR